MLEKWLFIVTGKEKTIGADTLFTLRKSKLVWYSLIELSNEANHMLAAFDCCSVFREHFH